jgi:HD-like signal output (HDOD) protein
MKNVLFVDDETQILEGLRRMLRGQRTEWNMTFVESGEEALRVMAETHFDTLVSDMRMPGMDGAELLMRAQEAHPGTVRIILSGHSELEAAMRAVPVAHQFLSKPCHSDQLREVITRACNLQSIIGRPELQDIVGRIETLPSLPRIYNQLVCTLANPDSGISDVSEIVEQDSGITAKILQLVNSSFFGISRDITDIRQATTYLGMNTVRDLALSAEVFSSFEGVQLARGYSMEQEHEHSKLCARLARKLLSDKIGCEQAFLAAMLHDLGKLILACNLPDEYSRVLASHRDQGGALDELEERELGATHAEVGAYLLGLWGMPYPIVEAVANHHCPARVEHTKFDVLGAVYVANALVEESSGHSTDPLNEAYLESLGVLGELPGWRELAAAASDSDEARAA